MSQRNDSDIENTEFHDNEQKYMHAIYNLDDLRVSSIISTHYISHFDNIFPSGVQQQRSHLIYSFPFIFL